jgi:hypothetical protein
MHYKIEIYGTQNGYSPLTTNVCNVIIHTVWENLSLKLPLHQHVAQHTKRLGFYPLGEDLVASTRACN